MSSRPKARPKRASTASSTASAAAMTSTPMPSPGMTAMRNAFAFMDALEPPNEHDDIPMIGSAQDARLVGRGLIGIAYLERTSPASRPAYRGRTIRAKRLISFADSVDQLTVKGVASTSFTLALLDA